MVSFSRNIKTELTLESIKAIFRMEWLMDMGYTRHQTDGRSNVTGKIGDSMVKDRLLWVITL